MPLLRPIAGVEVGLINGTFIVNPTRNQRANSTLQLTLAGTKNGILMIEGAADFLSEEQLIEALKMGHEAIGKICDAISRFQEAVGAPKKLDSLHKVPDGLIEQIDQVQCSLPLIMLLDEFFKLRNFL